MVAVVLRITGGVASRQKRGFRGSTDTVAKFIAASEAKSIIGGGDTVASIRALDLLDQFDFVSTGGGAMLDFLATGTLPGLEALKTNPPPSPYVCA